MIFNDDQDLTVQKWQSIKSQSAASDKHVKFRGTLQEEVYNLGNYLSVLRKIKSFGYDDKIMAGIIRDIYKVGIKKALEDDNETPLDKIFTQQQKQTLVELVELFFGTEAFRSPSTIIETNMALDLIIAKKLSWEDALTKTEGVLEKIKKALENGCSNKDLVMMINGTKQIKDDVSDIVKELKIIFYPEGIDEAERDQSNKRLNVVIYGQSKLQQNETEEKRQERIEKKFNSQLKKKKDTWDKEPEEYQDKIDEFNKSQLNRWRTALEKQKQAIGGGGALSFTMKSSEDAGGIEAGRRLSEDVNLTHSRKHKYGGKPIDKETEGYKEYLSRKKGIVEKWLELKDVDDKWKEIQEEEDEKKPKSSTSEATAEKVERPSPKTAISNPSSLKKLIGKKEQEWYK